MFFFSLFCCFFLKLNSRPQCQKHITVIIQCLFSLSVLLLGISQDFLSRYPSLFCQDNRHSKTIEKCITIRFRRDDEALIFGFIYQNYWITIFWFMVYFRLKVIVLWISSKLSKIQKRFCVICFFLSIRFIFFSFCVTLFGLFLTPNLPKF